MYVIAQIRGKPPIISPFLIDQLPPSPTRRFQNGAQSSAWWYSSSTTNVRQESL